MAWIVHDTPGRIIQTVEGGADESFGSRVAEMGLTAQEVPLPAILGKPIGSIWWDGAAVSDRPVLPATLSKTSIIANGTDAAALTGLPDPCTVTVAGTDVVVTGGTASVKSAYPTTMVLSIRHFPHLDWSATVVATAP